MLGEHIVLFLVFLFWILNLGISIWNAVAVGNAWVETKHAGGWQRFMAWMGAIMSASGFSWCYLILAVFVLGASGKLEVEDVEAALNLGYILIIPGVLFAGIMIGIDSWARAYRKRTVANFGVAGYNTFANMYNTYNAIRTFGGALDSVLDYFAKSKSKDSQKAFLVILIVVVSLGSGILTTWLIVSKLAARDEPLPVAR